MSFQVVVRCLTVRKVNSTLVKVYSLNMDLKCPTCDYENDNLTSLSIHFRRKHKGTAKQLRIALFHNGVEPTCACKCGSAVKFHTVQTGFSEYAWGHASRVNNNWGHNKEAQQKSQGVRREMHKRGEHAVWNRGETKETSEQVAAYGMKGSETIRSNPELIKQRSDVMRESRLDGTIRTLYGAEHSQWKGGTSALQPLARARLHSVWTYPKLKASGFRCQKCGQQKKLEVHHDQERFAAILQKAIAIFGEVTDDNFEQKSSISEWVADYHIENDVSGIVLCERCHNDEHSSSDS